MIGLGIGIILALVGLIVFLYLKDPEILTKTPSEILSGKTGSKKEAVSVFPVLLEFFVVSDDLWKEAFILHKADGVQLDGGVGFSNVPVGTKLYAPMDGYIFSSFATEEDENGPSTDLFVLSENKDWDWSMPDKSSDRHFVFVAKHLNLLKSEVKKGEAFAEVAEINEISKGYYDKEVDLIVGINNAWVVVVDSSVKNPKDYLEKALEKLN